MNKLTKFLNSAYDRWSKYKRPILIVFALSMSYIFYRDHNLVEQLRKYIVAPYLSNFNPSILFNVVIFIATILLLILKLYRSLKNKPIPSLEINISIATILVILAFERANPSFQFKYVEIFPGLTYFDFVLLVIFCIILISLMPYIYFWFSKKKSRGKSSFTKDFTGDSKECPVDKLGREKFAEEIGKQILNLEPEKGSFCIGIEGSWGSGKSFMLNLIERHITDKAITIDFNPWKGNETKNIYRDFFYTLSETLGKFDKSINTRLIRYYTVLSDDNSGSIWYYLKSLIFNTQSLQGISEKINERLKCLKKPIVIFIDDIDRLQAEEIFDLLKLIRNISNFNNTVFVVAFDQEYLQNVLTVQNKSNLNFIDKIFQVVFHLPQVDINRFQNELVELIATKLQMENENIEDLKLLLETTIQRNKLLIFNSLDTPRDIGRFSNQIVIHYRFIKNCDYSFEDFFILELIRYRFPLIINELIYRLEFFLCDDDPRYALRPKFINHLKEYYEQEAEQKQIIPTHLVPQEDELLLLKLLDTLFGDNKLGKSNNSIFIKTNYYRYFSLAIFDNDLMYNEFKQAVYSTEYEKNLLKIVVGKSIARIVHLFEQLIGESFESKDKLIKLIRTRRIYNDLFNRKKELLSEFYRFLEQIIKENNKSKKFLNPELEEIILFCIRSKHDTESDLKHLYNISKRLHDSDSVSEIGITFSNLKILTQELFSEIITRENCSLDDAYNAWIFTKFPPESDKSPQPSTQNLRKFILEKFKTDFIEHYYSVLDAPKNFETYVNLLMIFPTKLEDKNTSEFLENFAITIQIIKRHYNGTTDISNFLKNSIVPEMKKLKYSDSEKIKQFSEIVLLLNLPSELKDELRETFRNSLN